MNKAKDNNSSSETGTIENIKLLKGEWLSRLSLALAPNIKAGFPSPADDYLRDSLDFNRDLIKNPEATFYGRVSGDSMRDAGINEGDIAVIDRSLQPTDGDVIVAYVNEEFTIKYLDLTHKEEGYIELQPANPDYSPIRIDSTDNFRVWGVVVWTIKQWK
jgi:DNA polymerase V